MAEIVKNGILSLRCEGYTSDGSGVARADGRVVFVPRFIKGELARVKILKAGKNVSYGAVQELLEPSPHRLTPDCPVFGRCGGCGLRHMDYGEELRFKLGKVNDCLRRIGGAEIGAEEIVPSPSVDFYRNKTIYTVSREDGRAVTGFYRPRSHDVVAVERCRVESEYASRAAGAVREWMDRYGVPEFDAATGRGVRRVFCRFGEATGQGQVTLVTGRGNLPNSAELVEAVLRACPETVGILRNINPAPGDTVLGREFTLMWGREELEDRLSGLAFSISPGAFYQVNRGGAERLYERAIELAGLTGRERVLDLYCGTGTITLLLARSAAEAVGVEIVESAVKSARANAAKNGAGNVRFLCGDAGEVTGELLSQGFRPDVVTVDPPRKGLLPDAAGVIASMAPERIVYISCDPATLARDIKELTALGYTPKKAVAVDMFPRTPHVETVVMVSRVKD